MILLVEDEDAVRRLVRLILTREGYQVIEAGHPERALELVEDHADEIDLVLTDVIMPGMSGRELADRVREVRPVSVVYMSGYTNDALADRGTLSGSTHLLQKPFTAAQLTNAVETALGA